MEQEYVSEHVDGNSTANGNIGDRVKKEAWEWIKAIVVAGLLVAIIRLFIFAPFVVSGPSMEPNFYDNERLIVDKLIYLIRPPQHGEVIVFRATPEKDYIKRVIALPGETVKVVGDTVFVNGEPIAEKYIQQRKDEAAANGTTYNNLDFKITSDGVEEVTVPEGKVFVMGDNRPVSQDSREIGFVDYDKIIGRTDVIFWPLNKLKIVRH